MSQKETFNQQVLRLQDEKQRRKLHEDAERVRNTAEEYRVRKIHPRLVRSFEEYAADLERQAKRK